VVDEGYLDHGCVISSGHFEAGEHPAGVLESADESLVNVPLAIGLPVAFDQLCIAVVVGSGRNDRCDAGFEQIFVDPASVYLGSHQAAENFIERAIGIPLVEQVSDDLVVWLAGGIYLLRQI